MIRHVSAHGDIYKSKVEVQSFYKDISLKKLQLYLFSCN
jgi:hypothetical protein